MCKWCVLNDNCIKHYDNFIELYDNFIELYDNFIELYDKFIEGGRQGGREALEAFGFFIIVLYVIFQ